MFSRALYKLNNFSGELSNTFSTQGFLYLNFNHPELNEKTKWLNSYWSWKRFFFTISFQWKFNNRSKTFLASKKQLISFWMFNIAHVLHDQSHSHEGNDNFKRLKRNESGKVFLCESVISTLSLRLRKKFLYLPSRRKNF